MCSLMMLLINSCDQIGPKLHAPKLPFMNMYVRVCLLIVIILLILSVAIFNIVNHIRGFHTVHYKV